MARTEQGSLTRMIPEWRSCCGVLLPVIRALGGRQCRESRCRARGDLGAETGGQRVGEPD